MAGTLQIISVRQQTIYPSSKDSRDGIMSLSDYTSAENQMTRFSLC